MFEMRGMQRSPSMEFKELTQKDAQICLAMELDKLTRTVPTGSREVVEKDCQGFRQLFGQFINSSGPSVLWENIEKLPENAVSERWRSRVSRLTAMYCVLLKPIVLCSDPVVRQPAVPGGERDREEDAGPAGGGKAQWRPRHQYGLQVTTGIIICRQYAKIN